MSRRTIIVSGGTVDAKSADEVFQKPYDRLIGVDRGLEFLYANRVLPTHIVGDFDSIDGAVLAYYKSQKDIPIREFNPVKDASDTEIALRLAMELGTDEIIILGATGTRIDHVWANVQTLVLAKQQNVEAYIVDDHNRIRIIDGETHLRRDNAYGKYFSLFSLSGVVENLTITGAKYPLQNHTLYPYDSLCVSNQIAGEEAVIDFEEGFLALIETRD